MSRPLSPLSYGPSWLKYTQKGRERTSRPLRFPWLLPAASAAASAAATTATAASAAAVAASATTVATTAAGAAAAIAATTGAGLWLEAVTAVNGAIAPGLEGHLRVLAARCARDGEELAVSARTSTPTSAATVGAARPPAVRATPGLIREPLGAVKFLFPSGERKRSAAI